MRVACDDRSTTLQKQKNEETHTAAYYGPIEFELRDGLDDGYTKRNAFKARQELAHRRTPRQKRRSNRSPAGHSCSTNGPHVFSLVEALTPQRNWHIFSLSLVHWHLHPHPKVIEGCERYFGLKTAPDVPLDEPRTLGIRAEAAVWDAWLALG